MKPAVIFLSGVLAFSGLTMVVSSCVVADGRVSASAAIHYGPFDFWFYDRPWLNGWPWWHGGIYIQPPPVYIGPRRWPHIPDRPRVHPRP